MKHIKLLGKEINKYVMEGMRYARCLKDFSRKYFKEKEELSFLDTDL